MDKFSKNLNWSWIKWSFIIGCLIGLFIDWQESNEKSRQESQRMKAESKDSGNAL